MRAAQHRGRARPIPAFPILPDCSYPLSSQINVKRKCKYRYGDGCNIAASRSDTPVYHASIKCSNRNHLSFDAIFHGLVWFPVNTSRYCVISLRAVLRCAVENLAMSFKLHIFTHDQDIVQIPSKVSIIVHNMYLEASEMCV